MHEADTSKPLLIFGATDLASVLAFYLRHESERRVAAFVVDRAYLKAESFEGLPLVAFEDAPDHFRPQDYEIILPLGWTGMNAFRRERIERARQMGYAIGRFISPAARVAPGALPGENSCVGEGAILGPFCELGANLQIRSGVVLSHHVTVGDDCFLGARAVAGGRVRVGQRCVIGLGAVLRSGVRIADRCFIGAGAVVVADTEPEGVYVGCPARRIDKSPFEVAGR
jgi:sugar O-acyltransferase (sialic acid O-acetyltransferase NeuD family)